MNTWEYLAYAEAAETNRRLDDISQSNDSYRRSQAQSRLDSDMNYLFQSLYKTRRDISKINLSSVEKLKQEMSYRYNQIFYRTKPEKNILYMLMIVLMGVLSVVVYGITQNSYLIAIPFVIIVYSLYKMIQIKDKIYKYDQTTQYRKYEVYRTKLKYYELSSFGLYSKYYIDIKTREVLSLLLQEGNSASVYLAREAVYELFGFQANGQIEDLEHVIYWNHDLMKLYDDITLEQAQTYLNIN